VAQKYILEILRYRATPSFSAVMSFRRNQAKGRVGEMVLPRKPTYSSLTEPTRGIDVGAKEEIYKVMIELLKQGRPSS